MKISLPYAAALALVALVPAARASAQAPADPAQAARIPLADFKKGLDAGTLVAIDVRSAEAYRSGHIPGALSVPLERVAARAAELRAAGKPIVAYCT